MDIQDVEYFMQEAFSADLSREFTDPPSKGFTLRCGAWEKTIAPFWLAHPILPLEMQIMGADGSKVVDLANLGGGHRESLCQDGLRTLAGRFADYQAAYDALLALRASVDAKGALKGLYQTHRSIAVALQRPACKLPKMGAITLARRYVDSLPAPQTYGFGGEAVAAVVALRDIQSALAKGAKPSWVYPTYQNVVIYIRNGFSGKAPPTPALIGAAGLLAARLAAKETKEAKAGSADAAALRDIQDMLSKGAKPTWLHPAYQNVVAHIRSEFSGKVPPTSALIGASELLAARLAAKEAKEAELLAAKEAKEAKEAKAAAAKEAKEAKAAAAKEAKEAKAAAERTRTIQQVQALKAQLEVLMCKISA